MAKKVTQIRNSSPVEDIMGNPPARIVRWGTTVIALIIVFIIMASWYIRYPYIVTGTAEITTENPPANLVSKISGRIQTLNISEGDRVKRGEVLAVMETTASYDNIVWLSSFLDTLRTGSRTLDYSGGNTIVMPEMPALGELQPDYAKFRQSYLKYINHITIDAGGKKIDALRDEIAGIDTYIKQLDSSVKLYTEKMELARVKFERDSGLYNKNVFSLEDIEVSRQAYLKARLDLEQVKLDRASMSIQRSSKMQQLADLTATREEDNESYRSAMESDYLNLTARLEWWYQNYLVISPIDGRVTFNKYWGENQAVREGETLFTVVPENETRITARVVLSDRGSGKVVPGMNVNIKLNGYPYLEYGMVQGVVASKTLASSENGYIVDVDLPSGLTTNYGKTLELSQNMPGTAEIITDDMRLIERVIYPFKYLVEKNRR